MQEKQTFSDPTSYLLYAFTVDTFLFWGIYQGLFTGDTTLLFALVKLACLPVYLFGGVIYCRRGNGYAGALYILFGTLYSGMLGLCNLAYFLGGLFGWELSQTILGVPVLLSFFVLVPSMIPAHDVPWVEFVTWRIVMVWLLCCGLEYTTGSEALHQANTWLSLVSGLFLLYLCASAFLLSCTGKGLPAGRLLFRRH